MYPALWLLEAGSFRIRLVISPLFHAGEKSSGGE